MVIWPTHLFWKEELDKAVVHHRFSLPFFLEPMSQLLRQRPEIKGVTMISGEQKLALFADDVLISLTQPTQTSNVYRTARGLQFNAWQ